MQIRSQISRHPEHIIYDMSWQTKGKHIFFFVLDVNPPNLTFYIIRVVPVAIAVSHTVTLALTELRHTCVDCNHCHHARHSQEPTTYVCWLCRNVSQRGMRLCFWPRLTSRLSVRNARDSTSRKMAWSPEEREAWSLIEGGTGSSSLLWA